MNSRYYNLLRRVTTSFMTLCLTAGMPVNGDDAFTGLFTVEIFSSGSGQITTDTPDPFPTSTPVTEEERLFAIESCWGRGYRKFKKLDKSDDLRAIILYDIANDEDVHPRATCTTFDDGSVYCQIGILYLLPNAASYDIKETVLKGDVRIGLCALPGDSPAHLNVSGKNPGLTEREGSSYHCGFESKQVLDSGAIYLSEGARLDMFGLSIDGSHVDNNAAIIELRTNTWFFGINLTMTRDTHHQPLTGCAGLIFSVESYYMSLLSGTYTLSATDGTALTSLGSGKLLLRFAEVHVSGIIPIFTEQSLLVLKNNLFTNSGESEPVALKAAHDDDANRTCIAELNSECEYADPETKVVTADGVMSCSVYQSICKRNSIQLLNNRFAGAWKYIIRTTQDHFFQSRNNTIIDQTLITQCASEDSTIILGRVDHFFPEYDAIDPEFNGLGGCLASSNPTEAPLIEPETTIESVSVYYQNKTSYIPITHSAQGTIAQLSLPMMTSALLLWYLNSSH